MASEQQFCLRWNNHQSTLVAVFDTLLESGTLVDCTLAAEGQYLKAHKVVLSACSPYFELLLSQHYEKHPIIILKDVKFQELKAMMDYMYRGEVNISQDQLGALLKAAESLQIKGLSEGGGGTDREPEPKRHDRRKEMVQPSAPRTPPILPHSSSGLTIEHRRSIPSQADPQVVDLPEDSPPPISHSKLSVSRDGSISPVPRKRKKHRRRSSGDEASLGVPGVLPMTDNHETNSSCELPTQTQQTSIPATITPVVPNPMSKMDPLSHSVEDKNNEPDIMSRPLVPTQVAVPSPQALPLPLGEPESAVHKVEPPSEMMLEPKSEYLEEDINEDSVEDLTLDDDMDDLDQSRPGPSHGGESSSAQGTGFAPWHVASDRSTDEVFMAAQEAVGAHRDSQDSGSDESRTWIHWSQEKSEELKDSKTWVGWSTTKGEELVSEEKSKNRGRRSRGVFPCPNCGRSYVRKDSLKRHLQWECGKQPTFQCPFCPQRCKRKTHQIRHIRRLHKEMAELFAKDVSD